MPYFPQAGFSPRPRLRPGTQNIRASTGTRAAGYDAGGQRAVPALLGIQSDASSEQLLQPPVVADRSLFPNQATSSIR